LETVSVTRVPQWQHKATDIPAQCTPRAAYQAVVIQLFNHVRRPARDPADRENRGVEIDVDAKVAYVDAE